MPGRLARNVAYLSDRRMRIGLCTFIAFISVTLGGCVVVNTAASVTGTVVSTTVDVAGDVVKGAADAVTPSSDRKPPSKPDSK